MTFAVLEATLRLFLDEGKLLRQHPVLRLLTMSMEEIRSRCELLKDGLETILTGRGSVVVEQETSEAGSGSLATVSLPTWVAAVTVKGIPAEEIARRLRLVPVPVFGRIKEQRFLLDGRTIRDDEVELVLQGFREVVK
jgi:L-seryl-tRNA(Ser) seleniumtransferase